MKSIVRTVASGRIERNILMIRGQRVMLSTHLAPLYGVQPKVLMQAVKRNARRFPPDFMFQLTREEFNALKSQIVTLADIRTPRAAPYAFTDYGVAMLSSVLNSNRAVEVNIQIMRVFVRLREMLASNAGLARKLADLERKYDSQFKIVFDAIRQLMEPTSPPAKPRIGYQTEEEKRRARHLREQRI